MNYSNLPIAERPAPRPEIGRITLAREAPSRLGPLAVDPPTRRLVHQDGREQFLEPRVMQVLVALLRAGGQIVSRDELIEACWRGVVVGDDALNRVTGRLRRITEGIGAGIFQIETIAKVGYRLVSPGLEPSAPAVSAADAPRKASICVLPFVNMSDDPQQEYFSDGISEDITTDLSKVAALYVTARTTAFAYRDRGLGAAALARELGVGHVLEGSVRKAGGRVRIAAQLIDGATGGHVWAERYDRELADIFALQDEISEAIVAALRLKLLPEERVAIERRGVTHVDAYNLYLMARRYYASGREGDVRSLEAIERLCVRATQLDAAYAQAWSLLAIAQTLLAKWGPTTCDRGVAAAERALALDPSLAEAHATRARQHAADRRHAEANAAIARALALDPGSWWVNSEAGHVLYVQQRYAEAVGYLETAAKLGLSAGDPGLLMSSFRAIGDQEGVLRAARLVLPRAEAALARDYVNGAATGCVVGALAATGQAERARDLIEQALLIDPTNMHMRYNFACGAAGFLGDADTAFSLLAPVFETVSHGVLDHAKTDPDLAPIRDDPRWRALVGAAEARLGATAPA